MKDIEIIEYLKNKIVKTKNNEDFLKKFNINK